MPRKNRRAPAVSLRTSTPETPASPPTPDPAPSSPPANPWSFALPYAEDTMKQLRAFGNNPRATRQQVIDTAVRWVRWFIRDEHQLHYKYKLTVPTVSHQDVQDVISRCPHTYQWGVPAAWTANEKLFVRQKIQELGAPGFLVWLALMIETAGPDIRLYKRQVEVRSAQVAVPVEDAIRPPRIVAPGIYDIRPSGRVQGKEPNHAAKPQSVARETQPVELKFSEDGRPLSEPEADTGAGVPDSEDVG